MSLCVGYAAEKTSKHCQDFTLFEFDTLDVTIEASVLLKLWVEDKADPPNCGPLTFVFLPHNSVLLKNISTTLLGHTSTIPANTSAGSITVTFHSESAWETVQLMWSAACSEHGLSDEECAQVVASGWNLLVDDFFAIQTGLPLRQSVPTIARPFVFMHLEKTGGACFGTMLARTRSNWKGVVPCHGKDIANPGSREEVN